jgi:hypothetical protein
MEQNLALQRDALEELIKGRTIAGFVTARASGHPL